MTENKREKRMLELIGILNAAARAYYQESGELMSNFEYDRLYDELLALEKESGVVLANSPTMRVGYEVLSELPKEQHPTTMLSLDKTKSIETLKSWIGEQEGLLSWKLDGLTVVLSYEGGILKKAVTRGNGEIGEVITQNAKTFENLPVQIPFRGRLVLRGEAIIRYSDFQRINEEIEDADARYKNPRNLCSGSVRQLDPAVTAQRHVQLMAFGLVSIEEASIEEGAAVPGLRNGRTEEEHPSGSRDRISEERPFPDFRNRRSEELRFLELLGFSVVEHRIVNKENIEEAVKSFSDRIRENDFPSDGLVLLYEDIAYGNSLGRTAKFPRNAIAFKWSDETAETILREIEWSPSRTGLINPVAVFDPVELEGSTVSRASLHNISYCEDLSLGIGDSITVYKANMIIPQLAENLTRSGTFSPPESCPACGEKTVIRQEKDSRFLYCENPDCPAKRLKNFALLVSRDSLNIAGLSEATLEKLIGHGMLKSFADIFHLEKYREEIQALEGFGEKSCDKLLEAIKKASNTSLARVLYGIGIEGIGLANAKLLCRSFGQDPERLKNARAEELLQLEGIGEVLAASIVKYFGDPGRLRELEELLSELTLEKPEEDEALPKPLSGMSVVITGALTHFSNRKELQERIEQAGGRAAGSVSAKTAYLVNNDAGSDSAKNRKARELGVRVVTEEEFLKILDGENRVQEEEGR